jgi:3-polyprenyl-4-hydroxybenzoate decarboxylase
MGSRHYDDDGGAFALHTWTHVKVPDGKGGFRRFEIHDWDIYGTAAVAHSQGSRIVESYKEAGQAPRQYEVIPVTGSIARTDR